MLFTDNQLTAIIAAHNVSQEDSTNFDFKISLTVAQIQRDKAFFNLPDGITVSTPNQFEYEGKTVRLKKGDTFDLTKADGVAAIVNFQAAKPKRVFSETIGKTPAAIRRID